MRWALGTSLRFSRLVVALAIGVMVFGIAYGSELPHSQAWPSFARSPPGMSGRAAHPASANPAH
jgi:hypothetical protein